ncbi:MAG: hypothetical protein A2Y07_08955 [Planctomycetes bacterium GWF2_50_10]|nr:MAG: hypothetical protein A2Y07_08955 [Planctomycetes bacterium GWF2_50_10]
MPVTEKQKNELCTSEACLKIRPLWQRLFYPLIGSTLIFIGMALGLVPLIPGFPLVIIGLPLVACVHPRLELWVRRRLHHLYHKLSDKIKKHH